ncbi:MAG: hypothetical protein ACLSHL_10845 [Alistipes communis]
MQKELSARERTASTAADATDRQRTLLAEFSARPAASRAVVCDRIAEAVPAQVVLTRLAVEPLTKRFEAGSPCSGRSGRLSSRARLRRRTTSRPSSSASRGRRAAARYD